MRERINQILDELQEGNICQKILYIIILVVYYGVTLIIGLIIAGGLPYLNYLGIGTSSFSYENLNVDAFSASFYQNSSDNLRTLKVHNNWKDEIGAVTIVKPQIEGINVECIVKDKGQNCKDYEIPAGKHQRLYLNISVVYPTTKEYDLCFETYQGRRKGNSHYDCLPIVIFPTK